MNPTSKSQKITADIPPELRRVDRVVQTLTDSSRRRTQGLFDNDCVQLNGAVCHEPWRWLSEGDFVEVTYVADERYAATKRPPKYLGFTIFHEDEQLVIVDKPAAWLTVPSPKRESNTLVQRIAEYLTRRNRGRPVHVWAVQRLDRGVSGVIVMARENEAAAALRQAFAAHEPDREYVAIVAGVMKADSGTFRSKLDSGDDLKQRSVGDDEQGQMSITHFQVTRRWDDATLVRVRLETGRRNQIRVHFAEAGHPVLGDKIYEPAKAEHPRWPYKRLALHAERLGFDHPITGERLDFTAPLPVEFDEFMR